MSYSGHSFTPRGATPKKDKKRKQEFHKHKIKLIEEDQVDISKLKERTTLALEKLGSQKFSADPGGYTFSNWMTSFNMLLDDFEEKFGTTLPKEYYESRQKLTGELLRPTDTSDIDKSIENAEAEIKSTELAVARLTSEIGMNRERERETNAKIGSLRRARADSEKELDNAVNGLNAARKKQTLLNRLFSGKRLEVDTARSRVDSIVKDQESIDRRIVELENASETSDSSLDDQLSILNQKLTYLRNGLSEWAEKKEREMQLSEKRVEAASKMSKQIESLKVSARNISPDVSQISVAKPGE